MQAKNKTYLKYLGLSGLLGIENNFYNNNL